MSNSSEASVEMSCSKIVWTMLQEEGVDCVFGVSGMTNVALLHALADMSGIKFVHAAHESVAMAMADGYSRASGKLAVVVVHDTAGLSNTMGNLHNAYAAGSRVMVIAGQSDAPLQWSERYMDVDFRPMVSQVTKGCWMIADANDVPLTVNRALKASRPPTGGPVLISLSSRIQAQVIPYQPMPAQGRHVAVDISPSRESIESAAQLLVNADNPIIFASRAIADVNGMDELVKLAESLAAPVYTGNESKLIFPTNHPLYRGLAFQTSDALRNLAASADVLLMVGSGLLKYGDYLEEPIFSATTKVIQIDLDAQALAGYCSTELALLANPKLALGALDEAISGQVPQEKHSARMERLNSDYQQRKTFVDECLNEDFEAVPIRWGAAFREISAAIPEGSVVVDELASFYGQLSKVLELSNPGSYFNTCESLGWGLPATLGIALANPQKPVIALIGDGASLFAIQALWTAAQYQIPAVMVIFNNSGYGCMREMFTLYGQAVAPAMDPEDCASYDISSLNYSNLASEFGIEGRRVTDPSQVKSVMEEMIALKKPAVVELMVCPYGSGMNEMRAAFFQ
jgi:benzoylformate decarboxylase